MRASTWRCRMRLAPYHRRVRAFLRVRDDVGGAGAGGAAAPAAATRWLALLPLLVLLPPLPEARHGDEAAVLVQPNMSRNRGVDPGTGSTQRERQLVVLSCKPALTGDAAVSI